MPVSMAGIMDHVGHFHVAAPHIGLCWWLSCPSPSYAASLELISNFPDLEDVSTESLLLEVRPPV